MSSRELIRSEKMEFMTLDNQLISGEIRRFYLNCQESKDDFRVTMDQKTYQISKETFNELYKAVVKYYHTEKK